MDDIFTTSIIHDGRCSHQITVGGTLMDFTDQVDQDVACNRCGTKGLCPMEFIRHRPPFAPEHEERVCTPCIELHIATGGVDATARP